MARTRRPPGPYSLNQLVIGQMSGSRGHGCRTSSFSCLASEPAIPGQRPGMPPTAGKGSPSAFTSSHGSMEGSPPRSETWVLLRWPFPSVRTKRRCAGRSGDPLLRSGVKMSMGSNIVGFVPYGNYILSYPDCHPQSVELSVWSQSSSQVANFRWVYFPILIETNGRTGPDQGLGMPPWQARTRRPPGS